MVSEIYVGPTYKLNIVITRSRAFSRAIRVTQFWERKLGRPDKPGDDEGGVRRYNKNMGMPAADIEKLIREAFPDAEVTITALADDDDHWAAMVSTAAFKGKTRVQQHQMVYAALKGRMGGELHALSLQTAAKD